MCDFQIYPAIDLRRGQVVRLQRGDPSLQTTYSQDPAAVARGWLEAGARWLHVVNLDGAFGEGDQSNRLALEAILKISAGYPAQVQFGGGMRTLAAVQRALEMGVRRAVVGTLAVEQPDQLAQAVEKWGSERIAAGVDALDGLVRVRGWQQGTLLRVGDLAERLRTLGLSWLIFTDVSRDGMGSGLNLAATIALARSSGLWVIASGGVNSLEDVRQSHNAGLAGVIIGKALYDGRLSLADALVAARESS